MAFGVDDIIVGVSGNAVYDLIKLIAKVVVGYEPDDLQVKVDSAYDRAEKEFYNVFGDAYGNRSSSFLVNRITRGKIIKSIFYSSKPLTIKDIDSKGFDGSLPATDEALKTFINIFEGEMHQDFDLDAILVAKTKMEKDGAFQERISEILEHILKQTSQIKDKQEEIYTQLVQFIKGNSNIFRDSKYSESITSLLNMIFVIIEQNTGEKLLKKKLQANALQAENFEDVIFKIQKTLSTINKDKIENIIQKKIDKELHALHFYIQYVAPDFANKVNSLFLEKIQLIIDCIYCYEDKDPQYYLALGAMGLRNNHTDEKIYFYMMDNLINYLSQLLEVIKEKWENRDYKVLEDVAVEEMQKRLWYQINYSITEKNKQWIIEIVNNDNITDIELAKRFNVSVKDLRKELYSATKTFLNHKYVDDNTTSLIIYEDYKKVLTNKLSIGV